MTLFRHRWVKLLALLGVMLHAYAIVSLHGRMTSMAMAEAAAAPGSIVICRADGSTETISFDAILKGEKGQKSKPAKCPLCAGAVPGFAVAEPAPALVVQVAYVRSEPLWLEPAPLPVARAARPPATGPPAIV